MLQLVRRLVLIPWARQRRGVNTSANQTMTSLLGRNMQPPGESNLAPWSNFTPVWEGRLSKEISRGGGQRKIGIGGTIARPPLPQHRTCGSACGGSAG